MNPQRGPEREHDVFVLSLVGSAVVLSGSLAVGAFAARISRVDNDFAAVMVITTAVATALPLSVSMPQDMSMLVRRVRATRDRTRDRRARLRRTRVR